MPFSVRKEHLDKYPTDPNHWDEVYKHLIKESADKAGFDCERDDDDQRSRFIGEDIWRKIEKADVILCDLSSDNPNVNLEMGWALRADKKFVLIKDEITSINFDLNQAFTFTYRHKLHPSQLKEDIGSLAQIIKATNQDEDRSYSLVKKLSIQLQVVEAAEGNVEVSMMQKILNEIRKLGLEQGHSSEADTLKVQSGLWNSGHRTDFVKTRWVGRTSRLILEFTSGTNCFLYEPNSGLDAERKDILMGEGNWAAVSTAGGSGVSIRWGKEGNWILDYRSPGALILAVSTFGRIENEEFKQLN